MLSLRNEDYFVIRGQIFPQTESYCRASFLIEIKLSLDYPFRRPSIVLLDPIYHPNVNECREKCCYWSYSFTEGYIPAISLKQIIENTIRVIDNPLATKNAVNQQCAKEYLNDHVTYYKRALEMTFLYGRPRY